MRHPIYALLIYNNNNLRVVCLNDVSIVSYKAISPERVIQCFSFQFSVSNLHRIIYLGLTSF